MRIASTFFMLHVLVWLGTGTTCYAEPSISSTLLFMKSHPGFPSAGKAAVAESEASVTIRFAEPPSAALIDGLERHGVEFARRNCALLHTRTIYPAVVHLDSLDTLREYTDIVRIEGVARPAAVPTLDVSNPQVQAMETWNMKAPAGDYFDGSGVIVTNVDTGIDIYHPAFFRPDNGKYDWIDTNGNGEFNNGDAVDLDADGIADPLELLRFFDAGFTDQFDLMEHETGVYETDIDWLYNDNDRDNRRDFGPNNGFAETDPCFGELLFLTDDTNMNRRLDPGERLVGLGTSRIVAIYDETGEHYRGQNLFTAVSDVTDHGTPSCGIVGGQTPGRRLVGMAPGVEFICINRTSLGASTKSRDDLFHSVETALLWARDMGSQIMMYEYGSWVYEFLDGSSNMETLISELYDAGIHQFTATGNLAGPTRRKHAFLSLGHTMPAHLPFTVPAIGIKQLYASILWKGAHIPPTVTLVNGASSLSLDILLDQGSISQAQDGTLGNYTVAWVTDQSDRYTVKLDINITIHSSASEISGDFYFDITGNRQAATEIDAYLSDNVTAWMNGAHFTAYTNDNGTVTTPGTADKGITVGAYDPRGNRNEKGALNDFSSWGETTDGRRAVDIVAPGSDVYSISSHFKQGGDPGGYLAFGGTSSALPHVVGCAALIIQASPGITPPMLEQVLYDGALVDEYTGSAVPNDMWGYGKLRIFDALMHAGLSVEDNEDWASPMPFTVTAPYPNPFNHTTSFSIAYNLDSRAPLVVSVYSLSGQLVSGHQLSSGIPGIITFNWNGTDNDGREVSSGLYLFRFSAGAAVITKRAVFLK